MVACSEGAKDDTSDVCHDEQDMDPEHLVEYHGRGSAVNGDSRMWISFIVASKASAGGENGCLAAELGWDDEGLNQCKEVVYVGT